MDPVSLIVILIAAALGLFIFWVIIRSAVEQGIVHAARRMRENGWAIPTKDVSTSGQMPPQ